MSEGKRACVIGSGFGGLALAIRLQSAGIATTVIEARDVPGGRAYHWRRDGFVFDAGPTTITDPAALSALWELTGHDLSQDVELMPVTPAYRLNWPDGTTFDWPGDERALRNEIARIDSRDAAGFSALAAHSAAVHEDGHAALGSLPTPDFWSMAKIAPALARHQAWRSVYETVAKHIRNEKLREAFSFRILLSGGNPMTTSAICAPPHSFGADGGVWWARGGINRLIAGMVRHLERLGGTVRLHDPVIQVHTIGNRASEVETRSGWRERFDAVASNADLVHTYRELLSSNHRGRQMARRLAQKRFSPGAFVVHFGIEGSWPGIPHHTVLFARRYRGLLEDIYERGVLPADSLIYLHHPTVTDPSVAPEGRSTFHAFIPVANMGKLTIDWQQIAPVLEKRVLDEVGRRLIPDIHDRIVTKFSYCPRDFALDMSAHLGSAYGLEPTLAQSTVFRPRNRDDVIGNLYLVGDGTHPGGGVPGAIASAKATAGLMLEDLAA